MKRKIGMSVGVGSVLVAAIALAAPAAWTLLGGANQLEIVVRDPATCVLPNGDVLYAGGLDTSVPEATDTWTRVTSAGVFVANSSSLGASPLNVPREQARMVSADGLCIIVGGLDDNGNELDSIETFNESTKDWTLTSNVLQTARFNFEMDEIEDDKFIIVGGQDAPNSFLRSIEVMDLSSAPSAISDFLVDTATPPAQILLQEAKADFTLLEDTAGVYYVLGGRNGNGALSTSDEITSLDSDVPEGAIATKAALTSDADCPVRASYAAFPVSITQGGIAYKFLLTGGDNGAAAQSLTCLYSVANNSWLDVTALNMPAAATKLKVAPQGSDFVVVGGENFAGTTSSDDSIWWDTANDNWYQALGVTDVRNLSAGRSRFGIASSGGTVQVGGGVNFNTLVDTELQSIERTP